MTDMTRTLKMIADCDDEVHFERQVKRELLRLHGMIVKSDALARTQAERIAELEAADAPVKKPPLHMCADQHCLHYEECYRAQAKPAHNQPFWAVSPREGDSCRFYAPMRFSDGKTAMRG